MYCIIYKFEIIPDREERFLNAWSDMTALIASDFGGMGSRLHRLDESTFMAYAQWPDKETWQKARSRSTPQSKQISAEMSDCCLSSETLYQMDMVKDMLR